MDKGAKPVLRRPCEVYLDEYLDCKTLRSQHNHYYAYGEKPDCELWNRDYQNCIKVLRDPADERAAVALDVSERARIEARQAIMRANNVWTYRGKPPTEWNEPPVSGLTSEVDAKFLREFSTKVEQSWFVRKTGCPIM